MHGLNNVPKERNDTCTERSLAIIRDALSRCESLVLYRIMYGNRAIEVQRETILLLVQTILKSWGRSVCWGHGGIKLNN